MGEKKFTLELDVPSSITILESSVSEEVLSALKAEVLATVQPLVEESARRMVAQRLGIAPAGSPPTAEPPKAQGNALRELNVSLARGEITKEEYLAMKAELGTQRKPCRSCGKDIESNALFCRFCGVRQ